MELHQLRYFQMTARLEHMTKAANALHVAQPALSKTIRQLETELGVLLFDRQGKSIRLNPYGAAFLKRVDVILDTLEDGCRELTDLKPGIQGDVKLAIQAGSNIIPELLSSFRKQYPGINFHLMQHYQGRMPMVDADLCITSLPFSQAGYRTIPLFSEEIFLAVPVSHPLADKKSILLSEVSHEDFICLKPGTVLRDITDGFCRLAGFTPQIIFESDDPSTVRGFIKSGFGVAFIPSLTWEGTTGASMVLLHVRKPQCRRTMGIISREERYLPKAAALFRTFAVDYFKNYGKQG